MGLFPTIPFFTACFLLRVAVGGTWKRSILSTTYRLMSAQVFERVFDPGDLIYQEADSAQAMFLILSGTVELSVDTPEGRRPLAKFGEGDFLGDMALISNHPRAATARAVTEVTVEQIDDSNFEACLMDRPDRRSSYLALLMQRIRTTDALLRLAWQKQDCGVSGRVDFQARRAAYLEALPATENGRSEWQCLRLFSAPGTPPPMIDVMIPEVPFSIGRLSHALPSDDPTSMRLNIPDKAPFQLSRNHCEIVETAEGLVVRDLHSRLGTQVNGLLIGGDSPATEAALKAGQNTLILGGPNSPFRFIVDLAEM